MQGALEIALQNEKCEKGEGWRGIVKEDSGEEIEG